MRHGYGFKELSRDSAERKALLRAQCTSLIMHERIVTTLAKAKATQSLAEKLVTRAKNCNNKIASIREANPKDSKEKIDALMVHNHRMSRRTLYTNDAVIKLYNDIAPLFKDRAGGYTRIIKMGNRRGDAASMAILEFVQRTPASLESKDSDKKKKKAKKVKKTDEQKALDQKRKEDRKLARSNRAKASSAVVGKVNTRQKTGGGNG